MVSQTWTRGLENSVVRENRRCGIAEWDSRFPARVGVHMMARSGVPKLSSDACRVVDRMIDRFSGSMSELSVVELRRLLDENTRPVVSPIHSQEDTLVPTSAGDVAVRIYRPHGGRELGVVQWMHSGGFAVGSLNQNDEYLRKLSVTANVVVVSVDYRLAPEHPYPAAMNDCAAVWEWIALAPDVLDGVDVERCLLAGESAGGTMAMVLAHRAAEGELKSPVAVVNIYGPPDMIVSNPECATGALTPEDCTFFWNEYSDPTQRRDPLVNPARAARVDHLPPHYFAVAEVDVIRGTIEQYASRLAHAGVDVRTETFQGMMHGFATMTTELQPARALFDDLCAYIRTRLSASSNRTDEVGAHAP